jgi:predicted phosphoribosyltransferase
MLPFKDRREGGRHLALKLASYRSAPNLLVLGLPRGGVPVAYEVARRLRAPLDTLVVRKLGMPGHEELALGALASGGVLVLNHDVIQQMRVPEATLAAIAAREALELTRREVAFRGSRPPLQLRDKTVILVDDGLATGATLRAAATAVRSASPKTLVVAVPVGSIDTCMAMRAIADDVMCAETPTPFVSVGSWYQDFAQTNDDEVRLLLDRARDESTGAEAISTDSLRRPS